MTAIHATGQRTLPVSYSPRPVRSARQRLSLIRRSPAARDLRRAARAVTGLAAVAAALVFLSLTPAVQR